MSYLVKLVDGSTYPLSSEEKEKLVKRLREHGDKSFFPMSDGSMIFHQHIVSVNSIGEVIEEEEAEYLEKLKVYQSQVQGLKDQPLVAEVTEQPVWIDPADELLIKEGASEVLSPPAPDLSSSDCCSSPNIQVRYKTNVRGMRMYINQCVSCQKKFKMVSKNNIPDIELVEPVLSPETFI